MVYVCNCNGFNKKDIRRAYDEKGARRTAEVFRALDCTPGCGTNCVKEIRDILREFKQQDGIPLKPVKPPIEIAKPPDDAAPAESVPETPAREDTAAAPPAKQGLPVRRHSPRVVGIH